MTTKPGRGFLDRGLLAQQLAEVSRDLAQRRIVIPAAPNVEYRELSGLPPTIRLGPGKLELACIDAQDLLRRLNGTRAGRWRYANVVDRKQEAI
ncbi:MAG TPA: hypothetical protein VK752_08230 [Bryobacteraceae bacterium]|nr:hypothetical protein [Bryobacteraceae bacterium]